MLFRDALNYAITKANLGKAGSTDRGVMAFAKMAFNRSAERVWDSYNWPNSKVSLLKLVTDEAEVTFPDYVAGVLAARRDNQRMAPKDAELMTASDPDMFELIGPPAAYLGLPDAAVTAQPATATPLFCASDNGGDQGGVMIDGTLADGSTARCQVTLNGTEGVATELPFASVLSVAKDKTAGTVFVSDGVSVLASLRPDDDRSAYVRVKLVPAPDEETTLYFQVKRKFYPLSDDRDVFPVREAEDAVIDATVAELFDYNGNFEAGAVFHRVAENKVKAAIALVTKSRAREQRVTPRFPMFAEVGEFTL